MDIELHTKLLQLKGILNDISHVSYSYSQLSRQRSMNDINDETAKKLINAYEMLIENVTNSIKNYEQSKKTT